MNKRLGLDSEIKLDMSPWDFYGFVILISVVLMLIPSWPKLPLFMDGYYHLSVMRGFADAGGWTPRAFWEFAPVGRPQLYPPLFHILELALFRLGLGPMVIARLFDFLIYPFFLFCMWWPLRRLLDKRVAFFALLLMTSSYSLYLGVLNNVPFAMALIFSFLAYYFLRQRRPVSSAAVLVFAFYSHTLMSAIGAIAFFGACFFLDKRGRSHGLWALAAALCVAAPFFVFQFAHRNYFVFRPAMEFYYADINVVLSVLAFLGLIIYSKHKGTDTYFVWLLASMLILLLTNRDRFLSGIGLAPQSFFGALAAERIWRGVRARGVQAWRWFFWGILGSVLFIVTPFVHLSPLDATPRFGWGSSLASLADFTANETIKARSLYHPKLFPEAAGLIENRSLPNDIFFSNMMYGGGLLAVLAHRATSSAMLREVKPFASFDPIAVARYIVWFKNPGGDFPPLLKKAVVGYGLQKAGETEFVYMYENPSPLGERHVSRAVVSESVCFFLIGLLTLFVLVDFLVSRKNEKKVDTSMPM